MPAHPVYIASFPGEDWRPEGTTFADRKSALWGTASPQAVLLEWIMVMKLLTKYGARIYVMPPPSAQRRRKERKKPPTSFDITYAADLGGWFRGLGFLFSNMKAAHRREEVDYAERFFRQELGLPIYGRAQSVWEGSSCLRLSPKRKTMFLGHGIRASRESCDEIGALLRRTMPSADQLRIQMRDPHIHLDTLLGCLRELIPAVLACRAAFAGANGKDWDPDEVWNELWLRCGAEGSLLIPLSAEGGVAYLANFREESGGRIFTPKKVPKANTTRGGNGYQVEVHLPPDHVRRIEKFGYMVHPIPLPFLYGLGGGAAACLTNDVTEAVEDGWVPPERYLLANMLPFIESLIERYPDYQLAA